MYFVSHLDRYRVLPVLAFVLGLPVCSLAVKLEMGRDNEVLEHRIETPNLKNPTRPELPWNTSTPATPLPKTEPGAVPPVTSIIPELLVRFKDLIGTRTACIASDPGTVIPLKGLLNPQETFVHTGVGTTEKTAGRDGTASIEVYMPTHRPATIEVRVINPDNTEEVYAGNSLLYWMRPNDKAKALVKFKGSDVEDSMYLNNEGDWSPNPQKYAFDVKAGQRVILSISGNPDAGAYVRLTGNAF